MFFIVVFMMIYLFLCENNGQALYGGNVYFPDTKILMVQGRCQPIIFIRRYM